ncbi:zinc knuckle CX2CX4HX4C containing protein [Tanacetum coccineum]
MEKGEGEEDIKLILNSFNSKMSHIMNSEPIKRLDNNDVSNVNQEPIVRVSYLNMEKSTINVHGVETTVSSSFAFVLQQNNNKKTVAVSELRNDEQVEGAAVVIPMSAIEEVSSAFDNTLYGYYIGKRLTFPLVENYVKNTWAKFGLLKAMHKNGFFFFQFSTREGMEKVLESGPWLVRLVPLILNIWSPNAKLIKEEICLAPFWVKLHNIPILAYSEVGVLIEMKFDMELLDSVVVDVLFTNGKRHSLETIEVEYEWKPPRCSTCCIFDHINDQCPKLVKEVKAFPVTHLDEEGFVTVNKKKATTSTPSHDVPNSIKQRNGMELKNYFASLGDDKDDMWINALRNSNAALNIINDNDSEDVDEELVVEEDRRNMVTDNKNKGENTPKDVVTHD